MSTYKPKNSTLYLYDFWINGNRFHGATGQKSKRAADKIEAQIRLEVSLNVKRKPPVTVDEAAGLYEDKLTTDGKWSKSTEGWLLKLVNAIGPTRLMQDVTQDDLATHFRARAALVSGSSVNREVDVARALWRYIGGCGKEVGEMPNWGAMRYAVRDHDPRELTYSEEDRLFDAIRADYKPFAEFALISGWRCSEVRLLRWTDLDYPSQQAWATVKGGIRVKRPLTSEMIAFIANQPKVGPFVLTYVCQKTRKGRIQGERYPISKDGWRKVWATALKEAGVESFRFHDLRHTTGTRTLRATGNLHAVQKALRHKNIKTTLRYAHVLDSDVRSALEAGRSRTIPEDRIDNDDKSRNSAG